MILIPEIETVLILVPRTGSTSLRNAVLQKYPKAISLYRHMEADGVPQGYDRWRKVGVVRDPVVRLWSLYKFLRSGMLGKRGRHDPEYIEAMQRSVDRPFNEWLVENETTFTSPYSRQNGQRVHPYYSCRHPMPETRKSQWVYLRPDLGTEVYRHSTDPGLAKALGLDEEDLRSRSNNATDLEPFHGLTSAGADHILRFFAWDREAAGSSHDLHRFVRPESVNENRPVNRRTG